MLIDEYRCQLGGNRLGGEKLLSNRLKPQLNQIQLRRYPVLPDWAMRNQGYISTRWIQVAQNFKISIHRTIDKSYIRLVGDFDSSSAFELLNALWENLNSAKFILIDTSKLKEVYPFGQEVFYYNFVKIKNQRKRIRFVGPNALQPAPTWFIFIEGSKALTRFTTNLKV